MIIYFLLRFGTLYHRVSLNPRKFNKRANDKHDGVTPTSGPYNYHVLI